MPKFQDLTGKRFGKLTVIQRVENSRTNLVRWLCKCDCGNTTIVFARNLVSGHTTSCGCVLKEAMGTKNVTHGKRKTRIYRIYAGMKNRCCNKNNNSYNRYGGRGITICQEWLDDFMNFYNWSMNNGYEDNLTIDRIDVNGNYEPNNCRWVDIKTQCNNRRNNTFITYNNETHTISEWASILGFTQRTIILRLKRGWELERVFTQPARHPIRKR